MFLSRWRNRLTGSFLKHNEENVSGQGADRNPEPNRELLSIDSLAAVIIFIPIKRYHNK